MVAGVHLYGRRALSGRAAEADAALAEADQAASEQYVILSRNIERREHERLLHDTVLNTLTALARAGPGDAAGVVSRCRRGGFDPADIDRTWLGLRRSIAERMADCGGQASIWSAPGQGTVASLSWPGSAGPDPAGPARPELALPLSRGNPSW
jgi:hypothetical protein